MNRIPKCSNNRKVVLLKINKRPQRESVCISNNINTKNYSNKSILRALGKDISNLSNFTKNMENHKLAKKSSSYNEKDKVSLKLN